jgi:hypothetical protein
MAVAMAWDMFEWLDQILHPLDCSATPDAGDPSILVCSFRGSLGDGSSGNGQVDRMRHTIENALAGGGFCGLVLDLAGLRYTWGDHIWHVIWNLPAKRLRLAVVISPLCEQLGDVAARGGGWFVCRSRAEAVASVQERRG